MPPAVNSTTGSLPAAATSATRSYGRLQLLGRDVQLVLAQRGQPADLAADLRMCVVAFETSPVPASPFERIIAAPSACRRSASPRFVAPQTNGTVKLHLSMWLA
jgi:hypothetical protein